MTKAAYMLERQQYNRPQAMLWADDYGTLVAYPNGNLIANSNFETDTNQWTINAGATVAKTNAQYKYGTSSAKVTVAAQAYTGVTNSTGYRVQLTEGSTYTFSAWIKDDATLPTAVGWRLAVVLYSAQTGGSAYGTTYTSTVVTPTSTSWTQYSKSFTVPAGYAYAQLYIQTSATAPTAGRIAYVDAPLLQEGASVGAYSEQSFFYAPTGYEVGSSTAGDNFIILSDHNRKAIDFKIERIEKRERMINGRMRSYHIADKLTISTSWENLPSRSSSTDPYYSSDSGISGINATDLASGNETIYTVDGGAGGADLLKWYEEHQGPFWVFLSYDKPQNFNTDKYNHIDQYSEIIQMYVSDFSYTVEKRGSRNMDFWNVSVTLEEV
jgi:hypothetical protein